MAITKSKLSVSRELGRNKRIISGVGSGATNGAGGAFGGGMNIMALQDATDFAGMYWVIDKEGDEAPKKTPFVEALALSTFNSMFELVDNGGNPYIRAKYNFAGDGEIMAYADSGQLPSSIWDAMPKATASVLGGVKVGNNLTVDADGTLHAVASSGGASTWSELSDKPAWLAHGTQALFEAGHGHDWSKITNKPASYTPTSHSHSWDSITSKPSTFAPSAHAHDWDSITDKPTSFTPASHSHSWSSITSKPSTYTPSAHTQAISTITGLQTALDGKAATHSHPYLGVSAKAADSDLLDGYDSTAFLRKAESASVTGLITFNVSTGSVPFLVAAAKNGRVINLNADLLDGYHASSFPRKTENAFIDGAWVFQSQITCHQIQSHYGETYIEALSDEEYAFGDIEAGVGGAHFYTDSYEIYHRNGATASKIWHAANHGSGSGLDADLLDGYHASAFMRTAYANGYYGLRDAAGSTSNWIRTTVNGMIPYQSGGSGSLGTTSWPFNTVNAKNVFVHTRLSVGKSSAASETIDAVGNIKASGVFKISNQWSVGYDGTNLVFYNSAGLKRAKIDQSGNLTAVGEVTAFGSI